MDEDLLLLQSYYDLGCAFYNNNRKIEAASYFKLAGLGRQHNKALLKYAQMLFCGDGIKQNKKQALTYFESLACAKVPEATAALVIILSFESRKIASDEEMASYYFNLLNAKYKIAILRLLQNADKKMEALKLYKNALARSNATNNNRSLI